MCKNILIVDDDSGFVARIMNTFSGKSYSFSIADSLNRAKYLLKNNQFDIVLANVKVPGGNSLELKKEVKRFCPGTDLFFMSSLDSDYDLVINKGERCYHKYELDNKIGDILENV